MKTLQAKSVVLLHHHLDRPTIRSACHFHLVTHPERVARNQE